MHIYIIVVNFDLQPTATYDTSKAYYAPAAAAPAAAATAVYTVAETPYQAGKSSICYFSIK